jgi:hypothetical protein
MLSELHGDRRSTVALKSLRLLTRNLRAAGVPSSPVAG